MALWPTSAPFAQRLYAPCTRPFAVFFVELQISDGRGGCGVETTHKQKQQLRGSELLHVSVLLFVHPFQSSSLARVLRHLVVSTLGDLMNCGLLGGLLSWDFLRRRLEWLLPSSRGSSYLWDLTCMCCVSYIAGGFYSWVSGEAHPSYYTFYIIKVPGKIDNSDGEEKQNKLFCS